ncbi:MAG: RNB domain-containing ribonuclease [Lentisphaeria bacterium]|nr:RNB domain-containing ribonuclease [Lentisphaeria bacterium]
MPAFNTGALVLYHSKSAAVTAVNKEKIEIRIEGGSTRSVRPKDIEFLHPGPAATLPPAALPAPDAGELLALMEGETLSFGEFAELAYGDRSAGAFYSAWLLLQEGTFFTGSVEKGVAARPRAEIDAALAAIREKEEKQLRRAELIERIRNGALLPEDLPAMREIEQVALGESASSRLLRELDIEATPQKAHDLLLKLGVWDLFVNPWPSRAGVETADPALELGPLPQEERADLTHLAALAIDDEGSNDPDDAISYENGLLWVHVADPAALVTPGSPADDEAMNRGENLYLPESVTHMLPAEATELFGLGLQPESPALSFAVRIAEDGEATLEKMLLSTVRVERLTYGGAAAHWEETPLRELRPMLERFKAKRKAAGALFINLPEVKIKVEEREVKITPIGITPERELVANAMLAAGSAVAKYADEHGFALPFATQTPPEAAELPEGTEPGLASMFALRRSCPPSVVSTIAAPHSGLGLSCYARVTSPLRRYGDLLAHQQLRRIAKGEEPLSMEYLDGRIAVAEREALVRRRLERQSNEFWTQVFLALHPDFQAEAFMVLRQDDRLTYLIPELAFEFKNRFGGKIALGERVSVQLTRSDPAGGVANFRIV